MTLENWHYAIFEKFNNIIFGKTLTNEHFFDDGRVHHMSKLFQIDKDDNEYTEQTFDESPQDLFFFKLVKGNQFYILPRRCLDNLPLMPKVFRYMKLRKTDSQVWKYIIDMDSYSIPPKKSKPFHLFIDEWNPIEHSNPKSQLILKLICFSRGLKCGICGETRLGKNSDRTIKRHLYGRTSPKIKSPTKAKFYTELYYNDDINLDEITSWKREHINIVEDIMAEYGDESPELDKFSKDSNRLMECIKNINDRSFTFTFNPYSADNKFFVEDKFRNWDKIRDRFPIFYLPGKVTGYFPRPNTAEREAMVIENMPDLKEVACNTAHFWLNLPKEMHKWDSSKIVLQNRHLSNLMPLFIACDAYADTQEEFDDLVDYIQNAITIFNTKYAKHSCGDFIQTNVIEEEFIEGDLQ